MEQKDACGGQKIPKRAPGTVCHSGGADQGLHECVCGQSGECGSTHDQDERICICLHGTGVRRRISLYAGAGPLCTGTGIPAGPVVSGGGAFPGNCKTETG